MVKYPKWFSRAISKFNGTYIYIFYLKGSQVARFPKFTSVGFKTQGMNIPMTDLNKFSASNSDKDLQKALEDNIKAIILNIEEQYGKGSADVYLAIKEDSTEVGIGASLGGNMIHYKLRNLLL